MNVGLIQIDSCRLASKNMLTEMVGLLQKYSLIQPGERSELLQKMR